MSAEMTEAQAALDRFQTERAQALRVAREVLRNGSPFAPGEITPIDLVDVAIFVLYGLHPLDRYSERTT